MPVIIFDDGLCFENPTTPTVGQCEGATRTEWSVLEKPVGSQVIISDDTALEPEIKVSIDGTYVFELCCYFDEGTVTASPIAEPDLTCPLGVIAGQVATVYLNGCENDTIQNVQFSGVATSATFQNSGVGTVTTDATMPGMATVSVDCVRYEDDGTEIINSFTCTFDVHPADTQLVCTTSPSVSFNFVTCGQSCICTQSRVVFNCDQESCKSAQIGIVFKDCPECIDEDDCEPLQFLPMIGGQAPTFTDFDVLEDCGNCEDEYVCVPDMPVFLWNNLCSCPGWTLSGPAVSGSSVYNTCSCNSGQQWCFEGSATLVFSGPLQTVDTLVIWGHNIADGSVTTSPLSSIDGITNIGIVNDGACIEGYTKPVVINLIDPNSENATAITDFTVTITSFTGGIVCIDQIFVGQKLFLPEDALPTSFQNPFDGTDYELEVKESECGPLSRSLKHVPVPMSLQIECASYKWIKEKWRPYLRYAQRHGVLFQPSRNLCPDDIFNGWIPIPVGPSTYNDFNDFTVSIEATGYISQPQNKVTIGG